MDFPHIFHHGAVLGVTGFCHQLLMDPANSLLVDCGSFQGAEASPDGKVGAGRLTIDFPLQGISALVATHVHIDHVGRIPYLLAAGFKGLIICREPPAKLLPIVLEDAFKLGVSRDQKQVERYLKLLEQRIIALPYKHWFNLADTSALHARIRLQRAGHILASAYVEIDLHYPESGFKKRIVFSGDLGAPYASILPAPKAPYNADVLVSESTYGDRLHENRRPARRQHLEKILQHALSNQGTVLIPAFSFGRAAMLCDDRHNVLFVGYRTEGATDRPIQRFARKIGKGQCHDIRDQVHMLEGGGYSAHADQKVLARFVTKMRQWLTQVRIVHGKQGSKSGLVEVLLERYNVTINEMVLFLLVKLMLRPKLQSYKLSFAA